MVDENMLYACKMGPIDTGEGEFCAFFGFTEAGIVPPVFTTVDEEGLRGLREHVHGEELRCEVRLGKAARRLGFKPAAPPAWVAVPRANLAFGLSLGRLGEKIKDSGLTEMFLQAAGRFWRSRVWDWWADVDVVEVALAGIKTKVCEASVMGQGGQEFGIALYETRGAVARIVALADQGRVAEARKVNSIAVTFDDDPEWIARAIEEGYGIPVVPVPMKIRGGRPGMLNREALVVLGAAMEAASKLSPERLEVEGAFSAEGVGATVRLRAPQPDKG